MLDLTQEEWDKLVRANKSMWDAQMKYMAGLVKKEKPMEDYEDCEKCKYFETATHRPPCNGCKQGHPTPQLGEKGYPLLWEPKNPDPIITAKKVEDPKYPDNSTQAHYDNSSVPFKGIPEGKKPVIFPIHAEMEQNKNYAVLRNVLNRAYEQASEGKGAERHANGKPFEDQPMQTLSQTLDTEAGLIFQACKKAAEGLKYKGDNAKERAIKEYLGAINYLAGAVIYLENKK